MGFNIKSILEFLNPDSNSTGPIAIVGLGNPGRKYRHTRHNIGYMVIDQLVKHWDIRESFQVRKKKCEYVKTTYHQKTLILIKPLTFMNLSGQAVQWAMTTYRLRQQQILVIYDDYDLPIGTLRIRRNGSGGSHNGMNSVIERAGEDIARIRVGIRGLDVDEDLQDYVLEPFEDDEQTVIQEVIGMMPEVVESILFDGIDRAMNRFNRS